MLKKFECDMAYGDEASWHFIKMVLTGENDQKSCITFSKARLLKLLDLVLSVSKLDLKDP